MGRGDFISGVVAGVFRPRVLLRNPVAVERPAETREGY